jgi:tetratricopeptide (TPR) repeat protein
MIWWQKLKQLKTVSNSITGPRKPRVKRATPVFISGLLIGFALIYSEHYLREGAVTMAPIKVATYADDLSASMEIGESTETRELLFSLDNRQNKNNKFDQQVQRNKHTTNKIKSPSSILFDQALLLSRQDKYAEAIEIYQKVIMLKPNHQMATINLALLLKKSGDYPAAIQTLEQALRISGGTRKGKIYALLGVSHEALKQADKAVGLYKKSIEYRPSHALTWRRLAKQTAVAKHPYSEVIETYKRAIALNPEHTAIHIEKAQYQFTSLDFEGVIRTLTHKQLPKINQLKSKLLKARLLVLAYTELERFNKVKQHTKVFLNSSAKQKSIEDLALIAFGNRRYQHALRLLNSEQVNKPSSEKTYLKAKTLQLLGKQERADTLWKSLLTNQAYALIAQLNLAQALAMNQHKKQAITAYKTLLSKVNYSAEVAYKMSLLSIELKQEPSASRYAKLALSAHPHRRKYQLLLAEIDSQFDKLNEALTKIQSLSKRYPKSRTVLRQWARTLARADRYPEAIEKFRLLTANNQKKNDLLSLAKLLIKTHDISESSKVLEALLAKYNGHIEARYLLAQNLCLIHLDMQCQYQAGLVLKLDKTHSGAKRLISQTPTVKQQG